MLHKMRGYPAWPGIVSPSSRALTLPPSSPLDPTRPTSLRGVRTRRHCTLWSLLVYLHGSDASLMRDGSGRTSSEGGQGGTRWHRARPTLTVLCLLCNSCDRRLSRTEHCLVLCSRRSLVKGRSTACGTTPREISECPSPPPLPSRSTPTRPGPPDHVRPHDRHPPSV